MTRKRLDTSDVPAWKIDDWRQRLLAMPGFDLSIARRLAFDEGYGWDWPAVAALTYFPRECRIARG